MAWPVGYEVVIEERRYSEGSANAAGDMYLVVRRPGHPKVLVEFLLSGVWRERPVNELLSEVRACVWETHARRLSGT